MASRPIYITIVNKTGQTVTVADFWHNHGRQPNIDSGSAQISNGQQSVIYARESSGAMIGPQGGFNIYLGSPSSSPTEYPNFQWRYNHPYGSGKTSVDHVSPSGHSVVCTHDSLQHHTSKATYELK